MPRTSQLWMAATVVLVLAAGSLGQQFRVRRHTATAEKEAAAENVFAKPPRSALKLLSDSRKLLADKRLAEAVRKLGELLESPEDYLVPVGGDSSEASVHRSLKAEAERLLGEMPREGRELYELQYGARARQMLNEALDAGDMERLAEVSRRFFHTQAGYQATFLLGQDHFDHGRAMAGALVLQRLQDAHPAIKELETTLPLTLASCWLKAGMRDKAREAFKGLQDRDPAARVSVAGRELPRFEDETAAVDWLAKQLGPQSAGAAAETDRWLMFRGNPARNASVAGSAPLLNLRWRVQATDDPLAESALEQSQRALTEAGNPVLPAFHPLAVGDVLLMRSLQNLVAVDFATGKLLWWSTPADDGSEAAGPSAEQTRQSSASEAGQRMWQDMTFGTLSSDGRLVFSVEDAEQEGPAIRADQRPRAAVMRRGAVFNPFMGQEEQEFSGNRLTAHEIRTGKLVWDIRGPVGSQASPQQETFFLGPPLPLMGQLYVLGEIKGEVRLYALEATTGKTLWSQQLSQSEQNDTQRRWMGVSPSYADGVLVCPTSTGAVVGVELATRSLLWGYCLPRDGTGNRGIAASSMAPSGRHWADASVSIRDGRVIVASPESDDLHCLGLLDGKLLWKCVGPTPGHDDLYIACVDADKVVLVGRSGVRAVRLSDGKPAWRGRITAWPGQGVPSGRGFQSGNRYFVPLTSAEVVAFGLSDGKLAGSWKSRKGNVPGNLVCHKGKVISQGPGGVCAFLQLDAVAEEVKRRLAANARDAEALSLEGEILLADNKRREAIASFERAYELAKDARTRELLRDALLEGLQTEFASYRGKSAEVGQLLDDTVQHAAFLRAVGRGLRSAGEWSRALETYLKLADLEPDRRPLDSISDSLAVRRDRWIQGELGDLLKQADQATAAASQEALSKRLRSAMEDGSLERLREFVGYFGNQPAGKAASDELIRKLRNGGRLLEAELAAGDEGRGSAAAGSARGEVEWPTGKVEVTTSGRAETAGINHASFPVEWDSAHPLFPTLALRYDYGRMAIVACDEYGRERWQVSLRETGQQQDFSYNLHRSNVRSFGHLLLVSLGWKVIAIDTLGVGHKGTPRVLWIQDLNRSSRESAGLGRAGVLQRLGMVPMQLQAQFIVSSDSGSLSQAVGNRQVCIQRPRELVAVDPCNGEVLWARQGLSPNAEMFGDGSYVFVLSPDSERAMLLNAMNGKLLGTRQIPRVSSTQHFPNGETKATFGRLETSCLGTFGRNMLLWWPEGHRRVMTLVDPLEGRDLWKGRKFANSARTFVVDEEAVAVMEPSGHFMLVSLRDGRAIADVRLQAEPTLQEINVWHWGDRYLLLTRGGAGVGNASRPMQPLPNGIFRSYSPIQRGRLYAFDERGTPQWAEPVTIENQLLVNNQPAGLPVLVFGCQLYEQQGPNGQGRWKPTFLCVDKRSGEKVYEGSFKNQIGIFGLHCNPEKKTIDMIVQNETVTLKFTDKAAASSPTGASTDKSLPERRPHATSGS
ncbi:MAG: PQQ-binding-like beta-propeller repeat protein [Planctomycetaceae bacterium]|nr:PQQ-binding-like beta-propeller repeat protein [Planctomycetaceae bacterium]